jgi:hypothetical protein
MSEQVKVGTLDLQKVDRSGIPMVGTLDLQLVCTMVLRLACKLGQLWA